MTQTESNVTIIFQQGSAPAEGSELHATGGADGSVRALLLSLLQGMENARYGSNDPFMNDFGHGRHQDCAHGQRHGHGADSAHGHDRNPFGQRPWIDQYLPLMRNPNACEHGKSEKMRIPAWLPKPVRDALVKAERYAQAKERYDAVVDKAARKTRVPSELLHAMITAGSGYDSHASRGDARGLMRVPPEVAQRYGLTDWCDPEKNLMAGARYMDELLDRFDGNEGLAVAAYYMGPECVEEYKTNPAARRYVNQVMALRQLYMPVRALV